MHVLWAGFSKLLMELDPRPPVQVLICSDQQAMIPEESQLAFTDISLDMGKPGAFEVLLG